jgi:alpha-tubulin suppressor-like RCC1 family protein
VEKKPIGGHWATGRTTTMVRTVRSVLLLALAGVCLPVAVARADSSGGQLAAYYDRQMVIRDGIAYGWSGSERPQPMISDVIQVGVGKDSYYALRKDGTLLTWSASPANAALLMREVVGFAAGSSGWLAINRTHSLWQGSGREPPRKLAERVIAAAVGDGSDYYIDQAGDLYVRSLANRAQSGSGRLVASGEFVRTATRVAAVRAHSGRALYLAKSGEVFATGSNVTGPLSKQGPGDKATAGGSIFTGASGIATGAAHSAAIRPDGSLWAWGSGFASEPKKIADHVVTVAAGSTSTIALTADGRVLAWDAGRGPRQIVLDR